MYIIPVKNYINVKYSYLFKEIVINITMEEIDNKLQDMLNSEFTTNEQQIFLEHFQEFLNRDNDFIINIEFAFKWIGFTRKDNAKCLLQKYFVINKDYIIFINKHNICDDISSFLPKEEIYDPKLGDVKLNEMFNPWTDMYKKGLGTSPYQDAWGLFDQVLISGAWLNKEQPGYFYSKQVLFNREFLVQKTGKYRGYSKRTWDGMTYNYGYSDHFPVYVMLLKKVQTNN